MPRWERVEEGIRRVIVYAAIPLSVAVLAAVVVLDVRPFVGPAVGIVAGTVLAVVLWRHLDIELPLETGPDRPLAWQLPVIVTALYVTGVVVSYRYTFQARPLVHYPLFAAAVGFIAYQIHRGQSGGQVLAHLCVVAFTTYWSSQLAYPAGYRNQDTPELLHGYEVVRTLGYVTEHATRYAHTPIQPIQSVQYLEILGLEFLTVYNLVAVLALTATIPLVGIVDRALPSISRQTALYAALFFSFISFTLNRGHIPNKINFFTPLTLIVVLVVLSITFTDRDRTNWVVVGLVTFTALLYGHEYSTGVTTLIVVTLLAFGIATTFVSVPSYGDRLSTQPFPVVLCFLFFLLFFSFSMFNGSIALRLFGFIFGGIVLLVFGADGILLAGAPTGRYGLLDFDVLLFATAVETFLLVFGVAGLLLFLRVGRRDLDAVAFWIIGGFGLIGVSIVISTASLPPHRIYAVLGLFGLNLTIALAVQTLSTGWTPVERLQRTLPDGTVLVVVVCLFAVLSLGSPIAAMSMSPLSDELPHDRQYETVPNNDGVAWIEAYGQTEGIVWRHLSRHTEEEHLLTMIVPHREMPVVATGEQTAMIDRDNVEPGTIYMYSVLGEETGIHGPVDESVEDRSLGGREFAWLVPNPDSEFDHVIYRNGETTFYQRNDS